MSQDNPPADHAPIEDEVHTVDVGDNLKSRATWLRLVFMVVFIVLANVAAIVATVVVILGFLWVLFTGETNAQLRDAGRDIHEAILEAAQIRLRPIVMTGLSTMFGALPLVLATGAGAETRETIGIVIVSGVFIATALTLVVVPVF